MNNRWMVPTALAAALAACSSVPERNPELERARARFASVQNEPRAAELAEQELRRAGVAVQAAEMAQADRAPQVTVEHLTYLAQQRITLAQETLASRTAQAVTAGAAAERDRVRLAQRTQEADTAQQKLREAEQDGARKSADLAQAERVAQDDKARLSRRDDRVNRLEQELKELNARKTDRGLVVTLGDMLFSSGQSRLQAGSSQSIEQLASFLKRHPSRQASIEGYTDNVGSDSSNQALSDRRAHSVMSALVTMGIGADRLSARGHGESEPVASNDSADGRQKNRRVEVVFSAEAGDLFVQ